MADKKAFDDKMEELANALADKALGNLPPDKDMVDCFKALGGYYASSRKLKGSGEEPSEGGFGGIRKRIADASNAPVTGSKTTLEH